MTKNHMTRPIPGRHLVDDEYIDPKQCSNCKNHSDHYWNTDPTIKKPFDIRDDRVFYCKGIGNE